MYIYTYICIYIMESYSAVNKNEPATWMGAEMTILS